MTRPTPESYYYSGQGRLAIGDRDPTTGAYSNVTFVGNVTSLNIDIEIDKFDHIESMTGNRATDFSLIKSKTPAFTFTAESLNKRLLSIGLFGTTGTSAGAAVTNEQHTIKLDTNSAVVLKHPNVYGVSVTKVAGSVALVENTDYYLDAEFGTLYPIDSANVAANDVWEIDYNYAAYDRVDSLMSGTPPEKYIRFEGLNTVSGDLRLIEIPRAQFAPLTGLEFINEEVGSGEYTGTILEDSKIVTNGVSKYFTEKRFAAGTNHA